MRQEPRPTTCTVAALTEIRLREITTADVYQNIYVSARETHVVHLSSSYQQAGAAVSKHDTV